MPTDQFPIPGWAKAHPTLRSFYNIKEAQLTADS